MKMYENKEYRLSYIKKYIYDGNIQLLINSMLGIVYDSRNSNLYKTISSGDYNFEEFNISLKYILDLNIGGNVLSDNSFINYYYFLRLFKSALEEINCEDIYTEIYISDLLSIVSSLLEHTERNELFNESLKEENIDGDTDNIKREIIKYHKIFSFNEFNGVVAESSNVISQIDNCDVSSRNTEISHFAHNLIIKSSECIKKEKRSEKIVSEIDDFRERIYPTLKVEKSVKLAIKRVFKTGLCLRLLSSSYRKNVGFWGFKGVKKGVNRVLRSV